jgi:hypothetical protein
MEHRWGKRISVDVPVTLRLSSDELVPGRIMNLSSSGALVRTQARLPASGRVTVALEEDGSCEGLSRTVCAHVVRQSHGGIGLEWSDFPPPAICALIAEATDTPRSSSAWAPQLRDTAPPFLSGRCAAARMQPGAKSR